MEIKEYHNKTNITTSKNLKSNTISLDGSDTALISKDLSKMGFSYSTNDKQWTKAYKDSEELKKVNTKYLWAKLNQNVECSKQINNTLNNIKLAQGTTNEDVLIKDYQKRMIILDLVKNNSFNTEVVKKNIQGALDYHKENNNQDKASLTEKKLEVFDKTIKELKDAGLLASNSTQTLQYFASTKDSREILANFSNINEYLNHKKQENKQTNKQTKKTKQKA